MTTVVYAGGGGRFGNQVLRFAHWLAWSLERGPGFRVANVAFWPYAGLLDPWAYRPGCVFPALPSRLAALADALARGLPAERSQVLVDVAGRAMRWACRRAARSGPIRVLDLDDPSGERLDLDSFRPEEDWVLCRGWRFEGWKALALHEARVRTLLRPASALAAEHAAAFAARTQDFDVVVGLLARRGDYRRWADGRYYFDWTAYQSWLGQLTAAFEGRRVGVVVAGDERIPAEIVDHDGVLLAAGSVNVGGHWFQSFLDLAACELVVSPPSTFSACAAFLGGARLLPLTDARQRLDVGRSLSGLLSDAHRDEHVGRAVR